VTTFEDVTQEARPGSPPLPAPEPLTVARVPAIPRMLHHAAHVTHDVAATVDFYTRVLHMKLVSSVIDDAVPSTGDPFPYIHVFFELADGSTIAFFESLDLPPEAPATHAAYGVFNHLALEAGSVEQVDRWAAELREHGVDVLGPVNHGIIYSIYFHDPNGIRLELTTNLVTSWKEREDEAASDVREWIRLKQQTAQTGDSSAAVEWIRQRRGSHKADLPV
jgi:catechol 2,3-dioxygenase-like lactoylglutathione lyase family enzyme